MNFFKDLKDEIENGADDFADDSMMETVPGDDDFDDFDLSGDDALNLEEELLAKMELEEALLAEEEVKEEPKKEEQKVEVKEEKPVEEVKSEVSETPEEEIPEGVDSGKITVISKGTVINGSIVSDGSLEVLGTVNGDINCLGKLTISGAVKGKSNAAEVYINTNKVDGGIVSKGSVKISAGTVVIGDVTASSCVVAGAVKGDLDVNGPVVIDSTAVVKGNISSKGIQINSGAVIDGFCALPYSSVDIDSYFDDED